MELLNMDMKLLNMDPKELVKLFNNPPNCPFCGSRAASAWIGDNIPAVSCTNVDCAASNSWFSFHLWCTRPLENALQSTVEEQGVEIRRLWLVEKVLRSNLNVAVEAIEIARTTTENDATLEVLNNALTKIEELKG